MGSEMMYVPIGYMLEFAGLMEQHSLNNVIAGAEGDEVLVSVDYNSDDEREVIEEINRRIGKHLAEN